MTAQALLARGTRVLRAAGIDGAAQDARRLLAHALGVAPARLLLVLPDPVDPAAAARFDAHIAARARHQPVAQIVGARAFAGHDFKVTPQVLDPRPETETLVAAALDAEFARVLDLGTGSGAILLALLAARPAAQGLGVDLSPAALDVARANADRLGVAARAEWRCADWCAGLTGRFDLIVSNPPYIGAETHAALAPDVRAHEPRMALVPAGDDGTGLAAFRAICAQAPRHLAPGGRLLVETGHDQGGAVQALFRAAGLVAVTGHDDLSGHPRVVAGRAPAR